MEYRRQQKVYVIFLMCVNALKTLFPQIIVNNIYLNGVNGIRSLYTQAFCIMIPFYNVRL